MCAKGAGSVPKSARRSCKANERSGRKRRGERVSNDFQPNEIRGSYDAAGMRFGLVVSRFNSFITERLLAGAMDALEKGGASAEQAGPVGGPGSFEISLAAKKKAPSPPYDT